MTFTIWAAIVGFVQRLFAPRGNLLVADIIAECTIHVLSNGTSKTWASKVPNQPAAEALIQGMLNTSMQVGKQFGVGINWQALGQMYPYTGPAAPPTPPVRVPPK